MTCLGLGGLSHFANSEKKPSQCQCHVSSNEADNQVKAPISNGPEKASNKSEILILFIVAPKIFFCKYIFYGLKLSLIEPTMGKVCLSVVMVMTPIMVSAGNISLLAFIWVAILLD